MGFVLPFLAHLDLIWSLGVRSGSGTSRRATRSATDTSCDSGGGGSKGGSEGSGGIRFERCRKVPPPEEDCGGGIGGGGSSWVDMDRFFLEVRVSVKYNARAGFGGKSGSRYDIRIIKDLLMSPSCWTQIINFGWRKEILLWFSELEHLVIPYI